MKRKEKFFKKQNMVINKVAKNKKQAKNEFKNLSEPIIALIVIKGCQNCLNL